MAGIALMMLGACSIDLGAAPFKCNKGTPKCPDGYECTSGNNCVKVGTCPESLPECKGTSADLGPREAGVDSKPPTEGGTFVCGNGTCESTKGETATNCPADCGGSVCGNGKCETGETSANCPADCGGSVCGNGKCETGETSANCPADCGGSVCGNGKCETGETPTNCPSDCGPVCGNGKCESGETATSCPSDCGPVCGNGTCESGETATTCPQDCAGKFGDTCTTATSCESSLICVNFNDNPNTGFCTKQCYTAYSICSGGPSGTYAECSLQVSTPTGNKYICGFYCDLGYPCPSKLKCDSLSGLCKP